MCGIMCLCGWVGLGWESVLFSDFASLLSILLDLHDGKKEMLGFLLV